MSRAARVGACPGRMPRSPATERASTKSASPAQTSRSGVTRCRSRGIRLFPFPGELPGLLLGLLDPAHVEERLLRQVVVVAAGQCVEGGDGLLQRYGLAGHPGELLGHVERLRQEALDLAGAVDGDPVLLRQLVDAQDRDDVLELVVALEDL